ncbi:tail assembly protein [Pyxidicoccus caerfyrddinensis]|uniref:tail assembly protein n=1 Tax=Pyxidicoccus caerfyrddinensis TaxID=2709663 RepID=UPI0013DBEB71|nr:hypothetical protein [Pyxidicoccus caerfyrddinensis]
MLTTVVLGGPLGRRFGRVWRLDLGVPSPAEAVRALSAVCEGFARYLVDNSEPGFHVFIGKQDVGAEELATPASGSRVITVMPALAGAKSGWFQVVLGAVLIAGGAVLSVYGFGAGTPLITMGASLVVGGVSQLLFAPPTPLAPVERPENQPSYTFNGPVNTLGQGHPVPLCYGELEVGSCVISAGIVTEWNAGGGFGGAGGSGQSGPRGEPAGGGGCPAPWVPVLLADGREVPAGELQVGDWVRTQHDATLAWGDFPVTGVAHLEADCWRVELDDGRAFVGTYNHRVRTEEAWVEVRHLVPGARLVGACAGVVRQVAPCGRGPVVRVTVEDAHTYQTAGFLSHNVKQADPEAPDV